MTKFDVVGVGNAIVDILAKVDDAFLEKHELPKGGMSLIDEGQAQAIYDDMPPAIEASGGSAANSLAGIASLGGSCAFIGKVKNDTLGGIFAHDLKAIGVHYETAKAEDGAATAKCLISVTEDAERTMATYLGATRGMTTNDVDEALIKDSKILYLEGYLWDEQHAKHAMRKAVEIAGQYERKVSLSLSDSFCVDRHRAEFLELIEEGVDILFCNEDELKSLFETDNLEVAIQKISEKCEITAATLGSKGSIIVSSAGTISIAAGQNLNVVDTTGAGDLYAAGFLYSYSQGKSLAECGKTATIAASEIIQHMGARPEVKLSDLLDAA